MKNPQRQTNHLQILASRGRANIPRFRPHIIDNSFLKPGDEEMCSFLHDLLLHSGKTVKYDGSSSSTDIVHRPVPVRFRQS